MSPVTCWPENILARKSLATNFVGHKRVDMASSRDLLCSHDSQKSQETCSWDQEVLGMLIAGHPMVSVFSPVPGARSSLEILC
jgi:hypothetical protein